MFPFLCISVALATLVGLSLWRWRLGLYISLLGSLAAAQVCILVTGAPLPDGSALVPKLLLIALCFRLGATGARSLGEFPVSLLAPLAVGFGVLGPCLLGGLTRVLVGPNAAAGTVPQAPFLLLGALLTLPDASGISLGGRRRDSMPWARGLQTVHFAMACCLLPFFLAGARLLDVPPDAAAVDVLRGTVPGTIVAFTAGVLAGWVGRAGAARLEEPPQRFALQGAATLLAVGAVEAAFPDLGALAALSGGFTTSRGTASAPRWSDPSSSRGVVRAPGPWLTFVVAATVFAWAGLRPLRVDVETLLVAAALWLGAAGVRLLVWLAVAGAYRWLRSDQFSWAWILCAAWISFPGTLPLALSLATGEAERFVAPLSPELLLCVLCLSILVEGTTTRLLSRRPLATSFELRWEKARGRRLALRACRELLERLTARGELEPLRQSEKEAVEESLKRREKLAELDLEELRHEHPEIRELGDSVVRHELTLASLETLERAAGDGVIGRTALEALRSEVLAWFRQDAASRDASEPHESRS